MGSNHYLSTSHSSGCGFVDVTRLEWWFSNISDVIREALGFALFSVLTLIEYILFKSKMIKPFRKRRHTQASFSRRAGSGAGGEAAPFQEAGCCGPGVHQVRLRCGAERWVGLKGGPTFLTVEANRYSEVNKRPDEAVGWQGWTLGQRGRGSGSLGGGSAGLAWSRAGRSVSSI